MTRTNLKFRKPFDYNHIIKSESHLLGEKWISMPTFFHNVITSWKIFRNCMKKISQNPPIFTECLWFNNYICIKNKTIKTFFFEWNWYKYGIMFLEDFLNNNDIFFKL